MTGEASGKPNCSDGTDCHGARLPKWRMTSKSFSLDAPDAIGLTKGKLLRFGEKLGAVAMAAASSPAI